MLEQNSNVRILTFIMVCLYFARSFRTHEVQEVRSPGNNVSGLHCRSPCPKRGYRFRDFLAFSDIPCKMRHLKTPRMETNNLSRLVDYSAVCHRPNHRHYNTYNFFPSIHAEAIDCFPFRYSRRYLGQLGFINYFQPTKTHLAITKSKSNVTIPKQKQERAFCA